MPRVVAVGRFDGVHLGHQHLLGQGRRLAQARGWSLLAYTFPPEGLALLPLVAKVRLLQAWADEVAVVPWEEVWELGAEEFLRREVQERWDGRAIVLGRDHHFGHGREADARRAQELGQALGLEVLVVPPLEMGGAPVSARRIREALAQGRVEEAAALLGRPPVLFGQPVPGAGLARQLGFPTINLALEELVQRPGDGVYAAWAYWPGGGSPGLFYLGRRPTFPSLPPSAEIHVLRPPPALTGETVEVHLLRFLRPDQRFASPEELARQIEVDKAEATRLLQTLHPPQPVLVGGEPGATIADR